MEVSACGSGVLIADVKQDREGDEGYQMIIRDVELGSTGFWRRATEDEVQDIFYLVCRSQLLNFMGKRGKARRLEGCMAAHNILWLFWEVFSLMEQ